MSRAIAAAAACALAGLVAASGARAAPTASFLWFPASPQVGEAVSLASTSTDFTSPITSTAWDLTGSGTFQEGGPVLTTSFSAAGSHVVHMRVIAGDGTSAIASEVIQVGALMLGEILPFPVVRIAGLRFAAGVKLRLLSVEAPPGARVEIDCRGRGCPVKAQSRLLVSTRVEAVTAAFSRFDRFFPAGVTLEIRITKPGQIGKYTRFVVRHRRAPLREDKCLEPVGGRVIRCPAAAEG